MRGKAKQPLPCLSSRGSNGFLLDGTIGCLGRRAEDQARARQCATATGLWHRCGLLDARRGLDVMCKCVDSRLGQKGSHRQHNVPRCAELRFLYLGCVNHVIASCSFPLFSSNRWNCLRE